MKTLNFLSRASFDKAIAALDKAGMSVIICYTHMLVHMTDDNLFEIQELLETAAGIVDDSPRLFKMIEASYWVDHNA